MVQFQYKAKSGPTKVVDGMVEADDLDKAIQQVIKQGLSPIDVMPVTDNSPAEASPEGFKFPGLNKVSLKDRAEFTRQMADLIEAHVPVLRAVHLVASQTKNQHFKEMIQNIHDAVRDGSSLSSALAEYPDVFSPLYVNLVSTGEVGGKLETVFSRLSVYLEKEAETRNKIRSSLAYPLLVLSVGILTLFVLLAFVVPRIAVVFEDLGQELPVPTQILMAVSGIFSSYWWAILIGLCAVGLYLSRWSQSDAGREWIDSMVLKVPVVGNFIKTVEVGRFSLTLGTLVETGLVITTALNSVWRTVQNRVLQDEIRQVSENVANGMSLRKALDNSEFFPAMAVNMIAVGEETGELDKSLYKIAETYERQSDEQMKLMLALLGPIVLIFVVIFIGYIVISLLLPIFQMNLLVQ